MRRCNSYRTHQVIIILFILFSSYSLSAVETQWQSKEVDWNLGSDKSIKKIYYKDANAPLFMEQSQLQTKTAPKKILKTIDSGEKFGLFGTTESRTVIVTVIESPPINGFVPWVVGTITDKRQSSLDFEATVRNSVVGNYPAGVQPDSNYIVGVFDTGASAHVMGYDNAVTAGLYSNSSKFLTSNTSIIGGALNSVEARISQPLGLFIDGIGAIDANGLLSDNSGMKGQSNVAIMVGQNPSYNIDLPSAFGTPLSVYFDTSIRNYSQVTINHNDTEYSGPDVLIYTKNNPYVPTYPNVIPLELRPKGAVSVQYMPNLDDIIGGIGGIGDIDDILDGDLGGILDGEYEPGSPSIIMGNSSQSLFFVHSVDLYEGDKAAIDKDRFMLDTGAQVTVIGSRIAARLGLNVSEPEFFVEIRDVTGTTLDIPGFYIDSLEIPALGQWLSFTNVPVIYLDVSSPEGGSLDGIIGMNLFVDFNLMLRGGGFLGEDDPVLEFEHVAAFLAADLAPEGGDGRINFLDFTVFAKSWMATPDDMNWNPKADLIPDRIIDGLDLQAFTDFWLRETSQ